VSDNSRTTTAVNPDLADRLQNKAESNTKSGKVAQGLLADNRFGNLFSNPDFEIDEDDENFKLRNPSGVAAIAAKRKRRDDLDSDNDEYSNDEDNDSDVESDGRVSRTKQFEGTGFRRVYNDDDDEEDEDDGYDDSESDSGSDGEDGFRGGKVRGEAYQEVKELLRGKKKTSQKTSRKTIVSKKKNDTTKKSKKAVMLEADDLGDANIVTVKAVLGETNAAKKVQSKIHRMNMSLEKRLQMKEVEEPYIKVTNKGGSKEVHYVPKDSRENKSKESFGDDDHDGTGGRSRRSIKDLGKKRFKKRSY
jgi:hypothetical protein